MRLSALYQRLFGDRVPNGPFRGMRHPAREVGSGKGIGARILGTYELELRPAVEALLQRPHDRVIVLGAAEGYYAIGLARLRPGIPILAWEGDEDVRAAFLENIQLNKVEQLIEVRGYCGLPELRSSLEGSRFPLVICDVEGAERELLDPEAAPELRSAEILVEIHDFADPAIGGLIASRFEATHRRDEIWTRERSRNDLPDGPLRWVAPILGRRAVTFMDEGRGTRMRWFHLVPRDTAGQ